MLYTIWTIGCQMNKADSERVASALKSIGLRPAAPGDVADVVVLNTCVVRGNAEEKVMGKLGALTGLKRRQPDLLTAVMGCLVPTDREGLVRQFPQVDLFFTAGETARLVDLVESRGRASKSDGMASRQPNSACLADYPGGGRIEASPAEAPPASVVAIARYVPIIYGCNNFCAYCIVPFRRGREASRPPDDILAHVTAYLGTGAREITLLGQNVDAYRGRGVAGAQGAPVDLAGLLRLVHEVPGLARLRFLTSHPRDMSDRLIAAVAELPKACPAINLPVQAGDDDVLRVMGRGYTVDDYRQLVGRMRRAIRGLALSTDLIVGFPGETDQQFQHSMDLLAELRFDMVHVAAYSPRPGTRAASMVDDVSEAEKRRRLQAVESLQAEIAGEINSGLVGSTAEVLVEDRHKGKWRGRTPTDKIVFFEDAANWRGRLAQVRISKAGPWSLQGLVVGGE
ncbi:MAG: tRNA (N6-isopentenyl adenosine(37)-C2)-methylthiotransferase MiaB [Chloroflexota bacterium]|nr:tRNA (N6-isopentenyl adenosine(37)-C2)-methylthiotransferase MiaB [Chloroflexota bacterium]